MVVKGEWIVVVEIPVPVVGIEENISTEEVIFNNLIWKRILIQNLL